MPATAPLLTLKSTSLLIGRQALLSNVELSVSEGDRIALVGRNGSGKSTLLKIMAGLIESDRGERMVRQGTTFRYLAQEPDLAGFSTVHNYVEDGLAPGDQHHRVRILLNALGLSGDEEPSRLSGGEARRAALARVLAPSPDILILDEPTNHLDLPAVEWLETELSRMSSAIVLVSHDRRMLQTLSRATLWLDRGTIRRLERGFGEFEAWRDEVFEQEERDRQKLDRKIEAELHWLRYGVTARRSRNQGRLRALNAMRQERREQLRATGKVKFTVNDAKTSGKLVIEATNVSKAFGERVLIRELSLRIARGDRLGIVGANGSGKTTLLSILTGAAEPDSGNVRRGTNIEIASLDQRRASLAPTTTLKQALTRTGGDNVFVGGEPRHVVSYMKDFLFAPEQAEQPVSALSGGERGRLMLARALATSSNLLVLDEPTNDLDLETLDLLQEAIADYPGTVLLVSHDRDFLDRTVTSVLAAEGNGRWVEYAGGYSDMLSQRDGKTLSATKVEANSKPVSKTAALPRTRSVKRKLGFREKHALETLPAEIDELNSKIARLRTTLADPSLFSRDPALFQKTAGELQANEQRLRDSEERWLELALLREELEG
jgi:ATP-binding cassette subfamily F protein uup